MKLAPHTARLLDIAEMTEGGHKDGAGKIGVRHEDDPLPQQGGRRLVLAGHQIGEAQKMKKLGAHRRVKPHRLLDLRYGFERLSGEGADGAAKVVRQRKTRIERQRSVDFGLGAIEILFV